MNKKLIPAIILLISAVVVSVLIISRKKEQNKVCFDGNCFVVELAVTSEEKSQGLMFREKLEQGRGMLFIFDREGSYPFWMKNTLIPLDIIWIGEEKEIVFIAQNIQPCSQEPCPVIFPDREARYVLEINGGASKNINLKTGQKADFELLIK